MQHNTPTTKNTGTSQQTWHSPGCAQGATRASSYEASSPWPQRQGPTAMRRCHHPTPCCCLDPAVAAHQQTGVRHRPRACRLGTPGDRHAQMKKAHVQVTLLSLLCLLRLALVCQLLTARRCWCQAGPAQGRGVRARLGHRLRLGHRRGVCGGRWKLVLRRVLPPGVQRLAARQLVPRGSGLEPGGQGDESWKRGRKRVREEWGGMGTHKERGWCQTSGNVGTCTAGTTHGQWHHAHARTASELLQFVLQFLYLLQVTSLLVVVGNMERCYMHACMPPTTTTTLPQCSTYAHVFQLLRVCEHQRRRLSVVRL